jgi:hypothetical protein
MGARDYSGPRAPSRRRRFVGRTEMPLPVRRPRVIMYGTDPSLLRLRSIFLRVHGYEVETVSSSTDLVDELSNEEYPYELLFVSSTVSTAGRVTAQEVASTLGIPIYQLREGISPDEWLQELSKLLQK